MQNIVWHLQASFNLIILILKIYKFRWSLRKPEWLAYSHRASKKKQGLQEPSSLDSKAQAL